jgi:F-type H+-transporting ATPase subunit b
MDFSKLLSDLNIDPFAFVINVVGFLLLLFVANTLVFKPINQVLEERQQDVRVTYDKLEAEQKQMQELKSEYEQRLASIEAEAREKIQSAIKEAQTMRDQIVSEANTRSREMVARAEEEVEREKRQAMITVREQVVDLALGATEKLIGDGLDKTRQRKLIADFIATQGTPTSEANVTTTAMEA